MNKPVIRKPWAPPFWAWDEWSKVLPKPKRSQELEVSTIDTRKMSESFAQKWGDTARFLQLCEGGEGFIKPVSLLFAQSLTRDMEEWLFDSRTADTLTWPPTRAAFAQAIAQKLQRSPSSSVPMVFAHTHPVALRDALVSAKDHVLPQDWLLVLDHLVSQKNELKETREKKSEKEAPASDEEREVEREARTLEKKSTQAPETTTAAASVKNGEKASRLLEWALGDDEARADFERLAEESPLQAQEKLAQWVKREATRVKGPGQVGINFWTEDFALPFFMNMPESRAENLLKHWPRTDLSAQIVSPANTFHNICQYESAWLKHNDNLDGMSKVLSSLFLVEEWTPRQRWSALNSMVLERPKLYATTVLGRLRLWMDLGGSLDDRLPEARQKASSAFAASPENQEGRPTVRQCIRDVFGDKAYDILKHFPPAQENKPQAFDFSKSTASDSSAPFDLPEDSPEKRKTPRPR